MTASPWLVELLLPGGKIHVRQSAEQLSAEQLRKQIRGAIRALASEPGTAEGTAVQPQQQQQQQQQQPPQISNPASRALLLAFVGTHGEAVAVADDFLTMFGKTPLPWTEGARRDLESYLECRLGIE
jgi:hypothetical protein